MSTEFTSGNRRDNFEDLDAHFGIILRWILRKWDLKM
jgi:hypothetical protein